MLHRVNPVRTFPGPKYALCKYSTGTVYGSVHGETSVVVEYLTNMRNNSALSRKGEDAHTYDLALPLLSLRNSPV